MYVVYRVATETKGTDCAPKMKKQNETRKIKSKETEKTGEKEEKKGKHIRIISHAACNKMSFDEILDLTADVFLNSIIT